jgi:hypothetical protein
LASTRLPKNLKLVGFCGALLVVFVPALDMNFIAVFEQDRRTLLGQDGQFANDANLDGTSLFPQ